MFRQNIQGLAGWVKALATQPGHLNLISGTYVKVEGKKQLHKVVL